MRLRTRRLKSSTPVPIVDQSGRAKSISANAAMFDSLKSAQQLTCLETVSADIQGPYTIIPGPPAGWVPPIGASSNTWANIYKNKQRIDYCVDQFAYLTNRVKCVEKFTVGPFLA